MRHDRAQRRMSRYLEGDLGASERVRLERHLAECDHCSAELRALKRTLDLLHDLPQAEEPGDIAGAVLQRIAAERAAPGWRSRVSAWLESFALDSWLGPVTAAAGLVGVVYLSAFTLLPAVGGGGPSGSGFEVAASTGVAPTSTRRDAVVEAPNVVAVADAPAPPAAGFVRSPFLQAGPGKLVKECLNANRSEADCARFQAWRLVGLGLEDTDLFFHEMETVPERDREMLMRRLDEFARHSGSAPFLAQSLRERAQARATSLAVRFEGSPRR